MEILDGAIAAGVVLLTAGWLARRLWRVMRRPDSAACGCGHCPMSQTPETDPCGPCKPSGG